MATNEDDDAASSSSSPTLPLTLLVSETLPPPPNNNNVSVVIDLLLSYTDRTWIAYGASSLLVITHFPLEEDEVVIGPVFRQVIELGGSGSEEEVRSVAWSPMAGRNGEVAAAMGRCVWLFVEREDEENGNERGSFCWTQIAILVRPSPVEALNWTGSGDGIVTIGIEVAIWKRKGKTWEVAWKYLTEVPQTMVSTTWCISGPIATVAYNKMSSSMSRNTNKNVKVCQYSENLGVVQSELCHPLRVLMIQWRPSSRILSHREVLLTCCLDGTVRLWCEIDSGRGKKVIKDQLRTYHVCATIEINQFLDGNIGTDIFVTWAIEIKSTDEESKHDVPGRCEWLIGLGPGMSLTFWSLHCLDDVSPLRFPRITLWKKQVLPEVCRMQKSVSLNKDQSLFTKVVISREHLFSPPSICSLFQMMPDNFVTWTRFDMSASNDAKSGVLSLDGHNGIIAQVAVHPYSFEAPVAVSLDSNGSIIFWSLSTISNCMVGMPTLVLPTWELVGKIASRKLSREAYLSISWAPIILNEYYVLLLSHVKGIDCLLINISDSEEIKLVYHKLCTIPFNDCNQLIGLASIFAIPSPSSCTETYVCKKFVLLGVWTEEFQALSWNVTIHCGDLSENLCGRWSFESTFRDTRYSVVVDLTSSRFPDPHDHDQVTSFSVVTPVSLMPYVLKSCGPSFDLSGNSAYQMATVCSDGSLKLWRSSLLLPSPNSELDHLPWELVGFVATCQSPVTTVALSSCGQKIATVSFDDNMNMSSLYIWEAFNIVGSGILLLEDTISFDGAVIALHWVTVGNGQLLLGVCVQNEMRIYTQRRLSYHSSLEPHSWICVASGHTSRDARNFFWGPGASPMLVYERYFCLFSKWSYFMDTKHQAKCLDRADKNIFSSIFTDCDINKVSENEKSEDCKPNLPTKMNMSIDYQLCHLFLSIYRKDCDWGCWSMLDVAEKLSRSLPIYHPQALLLNIYSGNWKRAHVAVCHLVGYLTSNKPSAAEKGCGVSNSRHHIPLINLPNYFKEAPYANSSDNRLLWGTDSNEYSSEPNAFNLTYPSSEKSEIGGFIKIIERYPDIEAITQMESMELLSVIDILAEISDLRSASPYGSLDEPGRRFWVALRFQQLNFHRRFGIAAVISELVVESEMIAWAFQSDCQENLFSSVLSNESSWEEMRKFGAGFWFTNVTQLRAKMEKLARVQYLKNKDPKDCALLYIALNRIQVLAALFKVSKNEKDKPLVAFLSRSFQEEKNKAAALKNAYVLMGKHQLELAIAFFLLGGDISSAVTVCAKNLGDAQLALVICRLVEGYAGPLERHLILKSLLPSATEKGDCWLVSLFEWMLGNYSESCMGLLGGHLDSPMENPFLLIKSAAFFDPNIGQYCLLLVTKQSLKNLIGESSAAILGRWATLITSSALNSHGLHLEALECLSSSINTEKKDEANISQIKNQESPLGLLKPFPVDASNFISGHVASQLESFIKLNLVLRYISILIMEHPSWPNPMLATCEPFICSSEYEDSVKKFQQKLKGAISICEQKYSLNSTDMMNLVLVSLCNKGSLPVGYHILHCYTSRQHAQTEQAVTTDPFHPTVAQLSLKATGEVSRLFARLMVCFRFSYSLPDSTVTKRNLSKFWEVYTCGLVHSMKSVRAMLKFYISGSLSEDITLEASAALDLLELLVFSASAWFQNNLKAMILIIHPILVTYSHRADLTPDHSEVDLISLKKLLCKLTDLVPHELLGNENSGQITNSIPKDEQWHLIGVSLWKLLSFVKHRLMSVSDDIENGGSLAKVLQSALNCISSSHVKHFEHFLTDKVEKGYPVPILDWLEKSCQSHSRDLSHLLNEDVDVLELVKNKSEESLFGILWEISVDPNEVYNVLSVQKIWTQQTCSRKSSKGWSDIHTELENSGTSNDDKEHIISSSSSNGRAGSQDNVDFITVKQKDFTLIKAVACFQNPKETYKKSGELFEAICINNIDQQQTALASNKKGILFFNVEDEQPCGDQSFTWSGADWPQNGWARSKSTPIPTFVSPGIGLGTKRGAHLGLGGATVGVGSYTGINISGLGWGTQEELEAFVDLPATVDNIRTRALSSHPSRPFFLAGSSNTHVYLWEFGKDKATATYGVLPAANVPPPYALASVSSLQFDHCGHRFATAASDGTICTWQLEVGGRSNVCPNESSLCFNDHAMDVTYVAASGSVVAACGYNSNDVNVVVWDTLAPPTTSQVSLTCHEGGARSLSVFDNDIGTGSVSPIIVTGGVGGDVGLHDFRFIATGKTKRNRQLITTEQLKIGERNSNGMLWYIPKAHSGSVTRIVTIPNTSMFLTGSKDGDVKLWDAKRSELIFCWTKLHERHTFLQPSSRGFGGVVRAGVTDIQICSQGFVSCGGDGTVKLVQLQDFNACT